jgi:hypothetical protein
VRAARIVLALAIICGSVPAQNTPPPRAPAKPSAVTREMREARHRLVLIQTRAIAYFHSMDSIEERLRAQGMVLHPETVVLRVRIEAELGEARAALDQDDLATAGEALDQAQALVDRLAAKLGG